MKSNIATIICICKSQDLNMREMGTVPTEVTAPTIAMMTAAMAEMMDSMAPPIAENREPCPGGEYNALDVHLELTIVFALFCGGQG
jgi:hypothetical protein